MPNCLFQFKQFAVWSQIGGFKVGTDAVLLGAWAAMSRKDRSILEVGTGTGVIALMLAQRSTSMITTLEIDAMAAKQAEYNFQRAKFGSIHSINTSLQEFALEADHKFDHVVCNPPYFQFSSKPDSETMLRAKHTDTLEPGQLFFDVKTLLEKRGKLSIIIPYCDYGSWLKLAELNGFYPSKKLLVRPIPELTYKRVLIQFDLQKPTQCVVEELILETGPIEDRIYTLEFKALLEDYFIRF